MNAKRKPRLASEYDKAVAELIATALRQQLRSDEAAPPDAVIWTMDAILALLDHFAEFGTFDFDVSEYAQTRAEREAHIPPLYRALRRSMTRDEAVARLVDDFGCGKTTVENLIKAADPK